MAMLSTHILLAVAVVNIIISIFNLAILPYLLEKPTIWKWCLNLGDKKLLGGLVLVDILIWSGVFVSLTWLGVD